MGQEPAFLLSRTPATTVHSESGGYAGYAKVRKDFLVNLPAGLSCKRAMAIGTAGFTAMQCAIALEKCGVKRDGKEVVVTGAGGGVLGFFSAAETVTVNNDRIRAIGMNDIERMKGP